MSKLTLLHTADVHLDAPALILGERAVELRARMLAFARFIDEALRHEVDLVHCRSICSTAATRRRYRRVRARAAGRLAAPTSPIHAALLPGTHDSWTDAASGSRHGCAAWAETVHLLAVPSR